MLFLLIFSQNIFPPREVNWLRIFVILYHICSIPFNITLYYPPLPSLHNIKRKENIFKIQHNFRSPQSWSGRSRPMMRGMSRSSTAFSNLAHFTSPNISGNRIVPRGNATGTPSQVISPYSTPPMIVKEPHHGSRPTASVITPRAKTPIRTRVTAGCNYFNLVLCRQM